jgi:hypothetical protein
MSVDQVTGVVSINNASPAGIYTITVNATDNCGALASKSVSLTVNPDDPCAGDTIKPTINAALAVSSLRPANNNLVNVGFSFTAQDNCTPAASLQSQVQVFANEDDQTPTADGTYSPDAKGIGSTPLRLRAERILTGNGRVYLIVVKVTDAKGNVGLSCSTVVVPKSNSGTSLNTVNAAAANAKAYCLANGGAPPAGYFVVGDGPVIGSKQ